MNSKTSVGLESFGAKASVETDVGKTIEHYKSEGSFHKNQSRIYFHKHITEFVSDELKDIRVEKQESIIKTVIFVDCYRHSTLSLFVPRIPIRTFIVLTFS